MGCKKEGAKMNRTKRWAKRGSKKRWGAGGGTNGGQNVGYEEGANGRDKRNPKGRLFSFKYM